MTFRTRPLVLLLAAALLVSAASCAPKGPNRQEPEEDGPPLPSRTETSTTATVPPSSAETGAGSGEPSVPAKPDETAALRKSAGAAALAAAKGASSPDIGRLTVGTVRLARDDGGGWWASVSVRSAREDVDALPVYLRLSDASWRVVDIGTGVEPGDDERFPPEVRGKL